MLTQRQRFLIGFLGLLWLAGVISAYYIYHKPFSAALAINIARGFGQAFVAGGIIAAGGAVGTLVLPALKVSAIELVVLQAAIGLGILSLGVFACGVTIGVSPIVLGVLLGIVLLGLRNQLIAWLREWRAFPRYLSGRDPFRSLIASACAAFLLLSLLSALAPPLKFDALVYHLSLPKAYLASGRIEYIPWLMYWGMPQFGEMLYTWAMALGGVEAATTLGWGLGAITLAGVLAFSDRTLGQRAGWVSLASLLAGSTLASSLAWGYVGWQTQLFGWGLLVTLAVWSSERTKSTLLLAGACAGFALGVKYTAGLLVIIGLGFVLAQRPASGGPGRIRAALLFAGMAVFVSSPWFLKNLLSTGNPAYPLLFPAGAMDPLRLSLFQDQSAWGDLRDVFLLPWRATTVGLEGAPGYSASIGPLLLGFGVLSWLGWGRRDSVPRNNLMVALVFALGGIILWAIAGRVSGLLIQTRLYLGLFPAFSLLAGSGYAGLSGLRLSNIRLGRLSGVLVILVIWFGVAQVLVASLSSGVWLSVFGMKDQETYLAENLGWYGYVLNDLEERSEEGPVLMLWEPRSYYCSPRCIPDETLDRWFRDFSTFGSPASILAAWRNQGITQLLVNDQGAAMVAAEDSRYPPEVWVGLQDLLDSLPQMADFGGIYTLYQVSP